jgi:hypothetical protein
VTPEFAATELYQEVECLLRFWRRRCFYAFTPAAHAPLGETDYVIDHEHLAFALSKVRYYTDLLAQRDALEVKP